VRTSQNIIVHPGRLKGDDSWHLIFVANRVCTRIARWFEQNVDMVLRPGEPIKKPIFQVYDQLAEEVTHTFTFKNQDMEGADRSPPARKGHWELGPESANDYIRAIGRLKHLTKQMRQFNNNFKKFECSFLPALENWAKLGNQLLKLLEELSSKDVDVPSFSVNDRNYIS
jgi:hypothetical protein